jgi:hypothetical protein
MGKSKGKIFLVTSLLVFFTLSSCTKDRPQELVQSADTAGLYSLSAYDNKTCTVETQELLYSPQGLSRASSTNFEDRIYNENLPFVTYKTNCPFMKDLPFRGKTGTKYTLKFSIVQTQAEHFLEAHKLATEETISFHEKTFATRSENGYVIPLFRYKINLYKKEFVKDTATGENTNRVDLFGRNRISDASDFKFSGPRQLMKAMVKEDILPARYFEGDWFFAYTVVSAHYENASSIGSLSSDFDFDSKSRVKFVQVQNGLQAVSTSVSKGVDLDQIENLDDSLFLPANYVDYRLKREGSAAGFEEEILDNDHQDSPNFRSRNFVAIDYSKAKSKYTTQYKIEEAYFEDLDLTRNYISFTIFYPKTKQKIKYALKRAPVVAKKPRTYHFDDMKYFGYLFTVKDQVEDARLERPEDYEALNMIQRFYPKNNVIKFHISSQTPQKYYEIAQKAVDAWQEAFEEAYSEEIPTNRMKIELVADRTDPTRPNYNTVSVGDIRYNIINIIDSLSGKSLLGYGPSIVDSESGEIISATSNVYVHPTRDHLINVLRNYVRMRLGILKTKSLMHFNINSADTNFFNNHYAPSVLKRLRRDKSLSPEAREQRDREERDNEEPSTLKEYRYKYQSLTQRHHNFRDTHSYNIQRIENQCSATFKSYFSKLFGQTVTDLNGEDFDKYVKDYMHPEQDRFYVKNEIKEFTPCLEKLIKEDLLVTLIHELGHNFGLAHNFMGSVDKSNYTRIGDSLLKTSSVMDYLPISVGGAVKVGKYDIAALRYSYLGKIQGYDLNIWDVKDGQSIDDWRKETARIPKKYMFCSDSEIYKFDPLCAPNDYGSSPLEIINNIISGYKSFVTIFGRRYDRYFMLKKSKYIQALDIKFFTPLKMFYETWRSYLGNFLDDGNRYLDRDSTATEADFLKNAIEAMKTSHNTDHTQFQKQYYDATKMIYGFLSSLVKEPSKYCIAQDIQDPTVLIPIEFESLRREIYQSTRETINTCDHEFVRANFLGKDLRQHEMIEFGSTYNDLTFSLNERESDLVDRVYQYGSKHSKALAMTIMSTREPELQTLRKRNFRPNFFDNPIYRQEMHKYMNDRILKGVDFIVNGQNFKLPFFSREKNFLIGSTNQFINSLQIPGRDRLNNSTVMQYRGYLSTVADLTTIAETERKDLAQSYPNRAQRINNLTAESVLREVGIKYKQVNNDKVLFAYRDDQPFAYQYIDKYLKNEEKLAVINNRASYDDIFDYEESVFEWTKISREDLLAMKVKDFKGLYSRIFNRIESYKGVLKDQIFDFYLDLNDFGFHILMHPKHDDATESELSLSDFYAKYSQDIRVNAEKEENRDIMFHENIANYKVPEMHSRRTIERFVKKVQNAIYSAEFSQDFSDQIDILHEILSTGVKSSVGDNYVIDRIND